MKKINKKILDDINNENNKIEEYNKENIAIDIIDVNYNDKLDIYMNNINEILKVGISINNNEEIDKKDVKSLELFIKYLERQIRNSYEYKEYIGFLKENINMNNCSIFKMVNNMDVKIEIHHSPLTLFEITFVIANYLNIKKDGKICTFDIIREVMKAHYDNLVGLIPLSTTVHELVHNGYIFIPTHKVFGDYRKFLDKYKIGVTKELNSKIELLEKISNEYNNDKNLNILKRKYIKIMNIKTNKTIGNDKNNSA